MKLYYFDTRQNTSGLYRHRFPGWQLQLEGVAKCAYGDTFYKESGEDKKKAAEKILGALSWCDAVIAQMSDNPANVELFKLAQDMGKPVIMDTDDALDLAADKAGQLWPERNRESWEIRKEVWPYVSAITTTNQSLSDYYSRMFDLPAYTLPNMIDWGNRRWRIAKPEFNDVTVGWMGCHTHGADLDIVKNTIDRLSYEQELRVDLQGYIPADMFELHINKRTISFGYVEHDMYPFRMAGFDIGLVPLLDEDFNQIGKSDLKFLEYTAIGAATVASNVGQYRHTISNKNTGMLVENTDDDWYEAIQYLADDKRREKMIAAATKYVREKRSIDKTYHLWAECYQKEIDKARKKVAV